MDAQSLISEAKETLLTRGKIMPMLYLELTGKKVIMFALDIISDSQSIPAQCGIFARLGWETCKQYPKQGPAAIGFYSEAWQVRNPENDTSKLMPVNSKKKQEIIVVQQWIKDGRAQTYTLPIIRDHKKRVIDVGSAEGPIANVSYQVASFLKGCLDAYKPDDEVLNKMLDDIQRRVSGLSPTKQQELKDFIQREHMDLQDFFQ